MNGAFAALAVAAASVGALHSLAPDHWVPFAALARARGWSAWKTARITLANFSLGRLIVRSVPATLAYASGGVTSDPTIAGNIGEIFFQRFPLITFDYATRTLTINTRRPRHA